MHGRGRGGGRVGGGEEEDGEEEEGEEEEERNKEIKKMNKIKIIGLVFSTMLKVNATYKVDFAIRM